MSAKQMQDMSHHWAKCHLCQLHQNVSCWSWCWVHSPWSLLLWLWCWHFKQSVPPPRRTNSRHRYTVWLCCTYRISHTARQLTNNNFSDWSDHHHCQLISSLIKVLVRAPWCRTWLTLHFELSVLILHPSGEV